jgi:general stress protein YciG
MKTATLVLYMNNILKEHYAKISKKGGLALVKKHGKDHMAKIGKLGGRPKKQSNPVVLEDNKVVDNST